MIPRPPFGCVDSWDQIHPAIGDRQGGAAVGPRRTIGHDVRCVLGNDVEEAIDAACLAPMHARKLNNWGNRGATSGNLMCMRRLVLFAAGALIAAACSPGAPIGTVGSDTPTTGGPTATTDESASEEDFDPVELERAPAVIVRAGTMELSLEPWSACWGNGCYDGAPPEDLSDVGSPDEILVEFPAPDWEFIATIQPVGNECGRRQSEPLEPVNDTVHRLVPIGLASDYTVTLFGRGPGGSVFVSFRWSTPTDGVLPVPAATASILADHDGQLDSYGVELPIWNLAETPDAVTGQVTVTSADGGSHTFPLTRQDFDCSEGSIYLTAPIEEGLTAAAAGSPPFTYEVTLELDGRTYTGTGVWPDDVDPECDPCVPLTFTPPLPALGATSGTWIEPVQIDGVWVFQHDPDGWDDALHGGTAEIADGYLYVDGAIVVWHTDRLDEAARVISSIKSGEQPDLLIDGGGISVNEGASPADLPVVITDLCPTSVVWFGAP